MRLLKHNNPSARIRLTTVLTQANKDQMFQLGEIGAYIGVESITIIPLRPQVMVPDMKYEIVRIELFKKVI